MYSPKIKDTTSPNAVIALNRFALALVALSVAADDNRKHLDKLRAEGAEPTINDLLVRIKFGITTSADHKDPAAVKLMQDFEDALKAVCEDVTGIPFENFIPADQTIAAKKAEAERRDALTPAEREAEDQKHIYDQMIADGLPDRMARLFAGMTPRADEDEDENEDDEDFCEFCGEYHDEDEDEAAS